MQNANGIAYYSFGEGKTGYIDLECSGNIEEKYWRIIKKFARSISWKTDKLDYPDEYAVALIPSDRFVWLCKITDEGKDRYGRSLALRVDATLFSQDDQKLRQHIAQWAKPEDILNTISNEPVFLHNGYLITRAETSEPVSGIKGQSAHAPQQREAPSDRRWAASDNTAKSKIHEKTKTKAQQTSFTVAKVILVVLIFLCVAGIVIIFHLQSELKDSHTRIKQLEARLDKRTSELEQLGKENLTLTNELKEEKAKTEKYENEVATLKNKNRELQQGLEDAREDAAEELRSANDRLNRENEALKKMRDEFQKLKSEFSQLMDKYNSILDDSLDPDARN